MPISIDAKSQDDFLYVHISGKLTDDDYKQVFLPALQKVIERYGHVNALVQAGDDFDGWTLHAMWDDARFGWLHRNDFQRIAVVGNVSMMEYGAKISNYFMKGELKAYKPSELAQALAFVQS